MSNAAEEKSDDNSSNQAIRSANKEEKSADNIGGNQSTRSANEDKSDDISSAAATLKKSGVIAAPKPRTSKRGVQKRPTTARNLSTYTKKKKRARESIGFPNTYNGCNLDGVLDGGPSEDHDY